MAGQLDGPFQGGPADPGGWHLAIEPELHFGADVLVPDLAGWRRERMPVFPDAPFFDLAPDWVCEILSPSTRRFDLTEKRALYAPERRRPPLARRPRRPHPRGLHPHRRRLDPHRRLPGRRRIRAAPFEALAFPLGALWPD